MFRKLISCLSSNSKKVLAALLDEKDPISAHHLADKLALSISQVRYSIKKIEACLVFKGIVINQKPNEGISIDINAEEKQELLDILQSNAREIRTLNQKERVKLILQNILTSRDGITLGDIQALTGVSHTSFYRDMEKVKAWLKSFSLELVSRRNKPLGLKGGELKIREAIQEVLFQNLGQDLLLQACVLPVDDIELGDINKSVFFFQIQDFLQDMKLPVCEKHIRNLENKYRFNLFDRVHIELTLYLGVMRTRVKSGDFIQKETLNEADSTEKYAAEVTGVLLDLSGLETAALQLERDYLVYLFSQCFKYGSSSRFEDEGTQAVQDIRNKHLAQEIVREIAKYLHAGLYEDNELTNCVEWELTYACRSAGFGGEDAEADKLPMEAASPTEQIMVKILTPILDDAGILNINEVIRSVSNHAQAALERVRSISCQRRVLLVCGAGIATAFSLRSQLNTQFPEIEVVNMVSVFELAHDVELTEGCDAIISTVPLGNISSIPNIHVNSLLTNSDAENIKKTLALDINQYFRNPPAAANQFHFSEVITKGSIRTKVETLQPVDVIDQVGGLLLEMDAIWPSYIKAMKNLYTLYGPYMVIAPNTALLHAGPEMGSKRLAISLITLEKPIEFGHKTYDPIKIAMAFSSPVNSVHTNTLSDVFTFFAIPENREKILAAGGPEEILAILQASELEIA
jgi:mannitol/fructose-specific phosphotransferase system IIA component (Ntr-type)/galactitol-specific phosphotransferase system IIB component